MIRKSPTKALDKEKEELRVMRAVFKMGEWDQRRKSFIERKNLKGRVHVMKKTLIEKEDLYRKRKLLKGSG